VSIVCADDYQGLARDLLTPPVWDFIAGGAGAELSVEANRRAFDTTELRPRVLVDVSMRDTATSLLGAPLSTPLGIAPTAYHRLLHAEGEVATARAAGTAGALYIVSIFASRTLEEIAASATGPLWLQLYWLRRREALAQLAARAAASGYQALVLTVDAPVIGRRLRDLRNGFAIDPDVRAVNLDAELMATTHRRHERESAIAAHAAEQFDPTITWSDLAWLRRITDLPIILKGVLTAEDARIALDHGVDGLIVSNHGGRQLDGAIPAIRALPEVVAAVSGRVPVLLDGGVRRGRDALIALALGASAVLVGRPVLWALCVGGADGVATLLGMLTGELSHAMALTGRSKLSELDPTLIA
jgi:4-hydroxymandelate oxidase